MDRERKVVRQLVDIEFETMVQCYVKVHIFVDNCTNRLRSPASFGLFHVAVETNEPGMCKQQQKKTKINKNS